MHLSIKIVFYLVLLIFTSSKVYSASWIQDQHQCHPPNLPNVSVECTWQVLEEFDFEDSIAAETACNEWLATKTDPDGTCEDSEVDPLWEGGWVTWPDCDVSSCPEFTNWLGDFYFLTCPAGTTMDPSLGCVQEDEMSCEDSLSGDKGGGTDIGNPFNTATGSKYHTETIDVGNDLIDVELRYTSRYKIDRYGKTDYSLLSPGWNHSYHREVSTIYFTDTEKFVFVRRGNGRIVRFNEVNGAWLSDLPGKDQLEEVAGGWEYLTEEGLEKYEFQSGGRGHAPLKSIQFTDGRSLTFEYAPVVPGFVYKITDDFGNFVQFNYFNPAIVPGHRINQIESSDGRLWNLGYDDTGANASHNLISITYPDNTIKEFHYEDMGPDPDDPNVTIPRHIHALTGITNRHPVGQTGERFATYEYDTDRRVTKEWHHAKDLNNNDIKVEELSIVYNPPGSPPNTRDITNSRNEVSTYEVQNINGIWQIKGISGPGCASCGDGNTDFVYDANNNLTSKTQDGVTTTYGGYDAKGQHAYKIEADGTVDARRMDYTYDARFVSKITSVTEPSVYANHDKVTSYVYNSLGQMTSMTVNGYRPDGTAISKTTSYEYNGPFNQISRIDGPRAGNVDETIYTYYADTVLPEANRNRLEKVTGPEGIVERDNIQWTVTGKVKSEDRPNGISVGNFYDSNTDRLDISVQSYNQSNIIQTKFNYLATGHIESVLRNYGSPEEVTLTLTYDTALRVTRVTDEEGNYVEYDLDTEGNQLAERTYDPNGVLKKQITQLFDVYDYVDSMTQSGVTMDYNYSTDGTLDNQVNGNGVTTEYSYDNLKRLTQINQDYNGANASTANTLTAFTYDAGERIETVTDARGNITNYSYDDFGNLITLVSPDTGTTSYVYDLVGNMTQKTDAKGVVVNMTYDGRSRITAMDYVDNSLDVSYVYDQGTNGIGQLTSMTDQTGSTTFTYDAFGNQLSKAQVVTGFNLFSYAGFNDLTVSNTYDAYNRVSTMSYPSGLTLNYFYDDLNQVNKITTTIDGQSETVVDQVDYLPFGPVNSINFGNGKNYNANYDNGYRLIDYSYGVDVTAVYAYDNNHNITAITREVAANNDSFSYDELDRLTYDSNNSNTLGYDKLGNRTSKQQFLLPPLNYTIDASSNKLLNVGAVKPRGYDANGNLLSAPDLGDHNWSYSEANRMASFAIGKTTRGEYEYNGIGQRVRKTHYDGNGGFEGDYLYIYDGQGQLIHESKYVPGSHSWDRETIWLGNRPVARVETHYLVSTVLSQDIYYIQTDHLNTPRWITDDAGVRIWSWESDAFGTTQANTDVDGDGTHFFFNMRFPGQYLDGESGMHYNYFRDYEPNTGRYVQSDPIGLDGGVNSFIYTENNPIGWIDTGGLKKNKPNPLNGPCKTPAQWNVCKARCGRFGVMRCYVYYTEQVTGYFDRNGKWIRRIILKESIECECGDDDPVEFFQCDKKCADRLVMGAIIMIGTICGSMFGFGS